MGPIKEIFDTTIELINSLQEKDRDQKVGKVQELLDNRERLLPTLKPPYSDEEMLLGQKLIELNKQLSVLLANEKADIQKDLIELKNKKTSNVKYENPYDSYTTDGVFYDKRK